MNQYIQLYSPHHMVAQANKTSKNTTNEILKNDNSSTPHKYTIKFTKSTRNRPT